MSYNRGGRDYYGGPPSRPPPLMQQPPGYYGPPQGAGGPPRAPPGMPPYSYPPMMQAPPAMAPPPPLPVSAYSSSSYGGSSGVSRSSAYSDYNHGSFSRNTHTDQTVMDYGHGSKPPAEKASRSSQERGTSLMKSEEAQQLLSSLGSAAENINIDALLQDERLKSVLFAGISKATAKLEQSLQGSSLESDNVAFIDSSHKSSQSLFPSARSESELPKPKSILKQKSSLAERDNQSDSGDGTSVLERTLQLLRGKSTGLVETFSGGGARSQTSSQGAKATSEALGQLASYDDDGALSQLAVYGGDEEDRTRRTRSTSKERGSWASFKTEAIKRETDSFDVQEKLYEQWRKSINKKEESAELESLQHKIEAELRNAKSRASSSNFDTEEVDSTVQNILQSIGFNFDLSKRMQELARKKKKEEDDEQTGIVNASASFLDSKDRNFAEDVASTLLRASKDARNIDSLIKKARESSDGKYDRVSRSPSTERTVELLSRERRRKPSFERDDYVKRGHGDRMSRERSRDSYDRISDRRLSQRRGSSPHDDDWQRERMDSRDGSSSRRRQPDYDYLRNEGGGRRSFSPRIDVATPPRSRVSPGRRDYESPDRRQSRREYSPERRRKSPFLSERFQEQPDEYFYPEDNEYVDTSSVPLLTSRRSSRREEDLTSGLIPSGTLSKSKIGKVENFTVMSQSFQRDDDSVTETVRRIVLPAKSDRKIFSPQRRSVSPELKRGRKRSPSPVSSPVGKSRRLDELDFYTGSVRSQRDIRFPGDEFLEDADLISPRRQRSPYRQRSVSPRPLSPTQRKHDEFDTRLRRNLSPERESIPEERRGRSPPRKSLERRKSRSPQRRRSRSPEKRRSRSPGRRRSPERRRSPARRKSPYKSRRSPFRRRRSRSRSGDRGTRSGRYRVSPRRSPPTRRSFDKNKSKYKIDKRGEKKQDKPVDVSKMEPEERKAYLKTMLDKSGVKLEDIPTPPVVPKPEPEPEPEDKDVIIETVERLADVPEDIKKTIIGKLMEASLETRGEMITSLTMKQVRLKAYKVELERLKKEEKELMRKSQRSGVGINDPSLKKNLELQESVQKNIEKIDFTDLLGAPEPPVSKLADKDKPKPKEEVKSQDGKKSGTQHWQPAEVVKEEKLVPIVSSDIKKADKPKPPSNEKPKAEDSKKAESSRESTRQPGKSSKIYYEYIDGGKHWCNSCCISATCIENFFEHCHGKKHTSVIQGQPRPWKENKPSTRSKKKVGVPVTRRVKGIELLFPVTGFYCSICSVFCGDFVDSAEHLKSDAHYDAYTEYIKKNPYYEKQLLLTKSKGKSAKRSQAERPPSPPPLPKGPPPPSPPKPSTKVDSDSMGEAERAKGSKKQLRKSGQDLGFEESPVDADDTNVVDMDLDAEDDGSGDIDIKVPKMVGKIGPVIPPLLRSDSSKEDESMRQTDGRVSSLDTFVTIQGVKEESGVPVVQDVDLNLASIPIPNEVSSTGPALPPSSPEEQKVVLGAKSLEEVREEQRKEIDDEKRMMGIDVDAEEEKPMAVVPVPPPACTAESSVVQASPPTKAPQAKPVIKTIDSLFSKAKMLHATKIKPKPVQPDTEAEIAAKIQEEIKAKIEQEKEKILKQKQKEEERQRRLEMKLEEKRKMKHRLIYGDSDSSEDESEDTEDEKTTEVQDAGSEFASASEDLPQGFESIPRSTEIVDQADQTELAELAPSEDSQTLGTCMETTFAPPVSSTDEQVGTGFEPASHGVTSTLPPSDKEASVFVQVMSGEAETDQQVSTTTGSLSVEKSEGGQITTEQIESSLSDKSGIDNVSATKDVLQISLSSSGDDELQAAIRIMETHDSSLDQSNSSAKSLPKDDTELPSSLTVVASETKEVVAVEITAQTEDGNLKTPMKSSEKALESLETSAQPDSADLQVQQSLDSSSLEPKKQFEDTVKPMDMESQSAVVVDVPNPTRIEPENSTKAAQDVPLQWPPSPKVLSSTKAKKGKVSIKSKPSSHDAGLSDLISYIASSNTSIRDSKKKPKTGSVGKKRVKKSTPSKNTKDSTQNKDSSKGSGPEDESECEMEDFDFGDMIVLSELTDEENTEQGHEDETKTSDSGQCTTEVSVNKDETEDFSESKLSTDEPHQSLEDSAFKVLSAEPQTKDLDQENDSTVVSEETVEHQEVSSTIPMEANSEFSVDASLHVSEPNQELAGTNEEPENIQTDIFDESETLVEVPSAIDGSLNVAVAAQSPELMQVPTNEAPEKLFGNIDEEEKLLQVPLVSDGSQDITAQSSESFQVGTNEAEEIISDDIDEIKNLSQVPSVIDGLLSVTEQGPDTNQEAANEASEKINTIDETGNLLQEPSACDDRATVEEPIQQSKSSNRGRSGRSRGNKRGRGRGRARGKATAIAQSPLVDLDEPIAAADPADDQPKSEKEDSPSTRRTRRQRGSTPQRSSERRTRSSVPQPDFSTDEQDVQEPEADVVEPPISTDDLTDIDTVSIKPADHISSPPSTSEIFADDPIVQVVTQQEDAGSDSDATITENVEDLSGSMMDQGDDQVHQGPDKGEDQVDGFAVQSFDELILGGAASVPQVPLPSYLDPTDLMPSQGSSGQGKDPPMSGVVLEETDDSVMQPLHGELENTLASEISPTEGLTFGLEEEGDSMDFEVMEMEQSNPAGEN